VNGLLQVDITFEGPEHGGIGSTKFSTQIAQDFSNETGLSPECTPQVQVLMVLKELLAQRRLNEPYQGGLSSYALLLLVISMIGERSIIREELAKTELRRRVVAAGGGNSDWIESDVNQERKQSSNKSEEKKKVAQLNPEDVLPKYSKVSVRGKESQIDNSTERDENSARTTGKAQEQTKVNQWKRNHQKIDRNKSLGAVLAPTATSRKASVPSSWASIARNNTSSPNLSIAETNQDGLEIETSEPPKSVVAIDQDRIVAKKPSSFADAVVKGKTAQVAAAASPTKKASTAKSDGNKRCEDNQDRTKKPYDAPQPTKCNKEKEGSKNVQSKENVGNLEVQKASSNANSSTSNPAKVSSDPSTFSCLNGPDSSLFPQGFHDVIEVLCSGETTPGKLLMHFLLFYGQHFESQSTAIDYSGTHQRDPAANNGYSVRSSYLQRRNAGSYDPVTGMLTVDPIVVYDPLEGAENNNVARSCYAWSSIRRVFAQSYMTLSSAAETNANEGTRNRATPAASEGPTYGHEESGCVAVGASSPLLELLLSF